MTDPVSNKRRSFLTAVSGLISSRLLAADAASPRVSEQAQLAINGGKPVRSTPLSSSYPGTQFYDVPADVDLAAGPWTVLVWCQTFGVPVANATPV